MIHASRSALALMMLGTLAACSDGGDDAPALNVRLFGTTFGTSQLVELDPSTGALLQTIGPVGYTVNGLEYDHTTGTLYATTSANDATFPSGLIEIDLATGAGTPIGAGAGMLVNNVTVNAAGQMFAWTEDSDDLVTVNKATGVATVVGDSALDTSTHGLAFDMADRLVFVNYDGRCYTLDPATGAAAPLATINEVAHHGDFHPVTNHYWGIDRSATGPKYLVVIDFAAGTMAFDKPTADDLMAVTFTR